MASSEDIVIVTTSVAVGTSAVQLSTSSERVFSFTLQADEGNSGDVFVGGDSSVTADASFTLDAKDSITFDQIYPTGIAPHSYNLDAIFVLASAAGQKIKVLKIKLKKQT